jgi:pyruvate,water dikinase
VPKSEPGATERLGASQPDGTPDFPIAWPDPEDERLTWELDDMHMPFAQTPLALDFVRVIASGFNPIYERMGIPMRIHLRDFHGYCFFAAHPGVPDDEWPAVLERLKEGGRGLARETTTYWATALPELQATYRDIAAIDVQGSTGRQLAEAWESAWRRCERAWDIHFSVIKGPYRIAEDLADLYEAMKPDAPPGEALRLIQGRTDVLHEVEAGLERLAELAIASSAIADRLRASPTPTLDEIAALDGGRAFEDAMQSFLERHGHLGQGFDDLTLPSWEQEPAILLGEVAQRLARPPEPNEDRVARLLVEADELESAMRERLMEEPDKLARFDELLALAREICPLTEIHNYWIDRKTQALLRGLSVQVGRRLARDGAIAADEDVFYLGRSEVAATLMDPQDRRPVVAARKLEHERQRTMGPPRVLGKPLDPEEPTGRFDSAARDQGADDELTGIGGSAGVARGPARVALGPEDFGRIEPGDIIVCPSSNPSWVPVFAIAGGLVTNSGGVLAHAAVVAREFGLPAVLGVTGATSRITDGRQLEIDGTKGTVRLL